MTTLQAATRDVEGSLDRAERAQDVVRQSLARRPSLCVEPKIISKFDIESISNVLAAILKRAQRHNIYTTFGQKPTQKLTALPSANGHESTGKREAPNLRTAVACNGVDQLGGACVVTVDPPLRPLVDHWLTRCTAIRSSSSSSPPLRMPPLPLDRQPACCSSARQLCGSFGVPGARSSLARLSSARHLCKFPVLHSTFQEIL